LSFVILSREVVGSRDPRSAREFERIPFPILGPEDLDARDFVVPDLAKGRDHFAQRQNAEAGQQTMLVEQLLARKILGVVDVKHVDQPGIDRFDHLDRRTAGIKVKTIDYQAEVFAIRGADNLVGEVECLHATVCLAEKLKPQRNVVTCGDVAEFS
jgi:hypothetical protein